MMETAIKMRDMRHAHPVYMLHEIWYAHAVYRRNYTTNNRKSYENDVCHDNDC